MGLGPCPRTGCALVRAEHRSRVTARAPVASRGVERPLICVLLLPAPLESFILRDQAQDLLRADGVVAVDPPRMPYGAFARMPAAFGDGIAAGTSASRGSSSSTTRCSTSSRAP